MTENKLPRTASTGGIVGSAFMADSSESCLLSDPVASLPGRINYHPAMLALLESLKEQVEAQSAYAHLFNAMAAARHKRAIAAIALAERLPLRR